MPRLLALVPYLLARPGIRIADAATDFDVTEQQLRRDLELLWMCGLPGHGPGDLIDLAFDGDTVSVTFDAGMSRPARLTGEEALALIVALRTVAETPGVTDHGAVERALAKVEAAAGGPVEATDIVQVALDAEARALPAVSAALDAGRALRVRYYTAARDETTERTVDPLRIFEADGRTYLEAWCRRAEGMRVFRLDRIEDAEPLDEPARPPVGAGDRDLRGGVFAPAPEHLLVELLVGAGYAWVSEYYALESETETPQGRLISLRVSDPAWVRALVLGAGGQVVVVSPGWLAAEVQDTARSALAAYPAAAK